MTICIGCGRDEDTRMGFCFDRVTAAEERALKRSVLQHIGKGFQHLVRKDFISARIAFMWAWERLTGTGDYAPKGPRDDSGSPLFG